MRSGAIWALVATGVLVTASAIAGAAFSFFSWALALNGFMGQERAVNASMVTFIVLASILTLACIVLSVLAAYRLAVKWNWHAAGAALLSTAIFSVVVVGLQILSVVISVIVASNMRTTR